MENTHDIVIYAIVGIIIGFQVFFFMKNFLKILAYKNIISSNEDLSLVELNITEEEVGLMEPEHFIKNKEQYISKIVEVDEFINHEDDLERYVEYDSSNSNEVDINEPNLFH